MTDGELIAEIDGLVKLRLDEGRIAPATWLTHTVVDLHRDIQGADVEFYKNCAYGHVRNMVRQVIRRYKITEDEDTSQIPLPGFKKLQQAYLVDRDGDQVAVPIGQCSVTELELKLNELQRMRNGLDKHIEELIRYIEERRAAQAQTAEATA